MTGTIPTSNNRPRLLAFASNDWRGPWMNRQQLLTRLAPDFPVTYSQGLFSIWDRGTVRWQNAPFSGCITSDHEVRVDSPPKFLLRWPGRDYYDRQVMQLGAKRWRRIAEPGPLYAYLFHPAFWPYVEALKPDRVIYHAYDLFRLTPGWNTQLEDFQRQLLARADLVLASSQTIVDDLRSQSPSPVEFLPNGADVDAFANGAKRFPEPDDLKGIPSPRIGYTGNINRKVDLPLIAQLARREPSWQFVFTGGIGNFDDTVSAAFRQCEACDNVHFLGAKNYAELPAYVARMQVNLMCYRTGDGLWTEGGYPLKLHEYLAAGMPVVSTPLPSVAPFTDVLATANTPEQWHARIADALAGRAVGDIESRQRTAAGNSWDLRAATLRKLLEKLNTPSPRD